MQIRYVGCTKRPHQRRTWHRSNKQFCAHTAVDKWTTRIAAEGRHVVFQVVASVIGNHYYAEKELYEQCMLNGDDLLNAPYLNRQRTRRQANYRMTILDGVLKDVAVIA